jgi:uncharacterized protein (DUF302 family)
MRLAIAILLVLFAFPAQADSVFLKKESAHSVVETIDKLEAALEEKGITVFARIDHAAGAEKAGLEMRPTLLLVFGNPKLGTPLMEADPMMGLDLPMKALAFEDESGTVWLAYTAPEALKDRHGIEGQDEVFQTMTGALDNFTDAATQ